MDQHKARIWVDNGSYGKKMVSSENYAMRLNDGRVIALLADGTYRVETTDEVMMWTGLKDKNGKKIFEGDIVSLRELQSIPRKLDRVVKFNKEEATFELGNYPIELLFTAKQKDAHEYEIIGNIYETDN